MEQPSQYASPFNMGQHFLWDGQGHNLVLWTIIYQGTGDKYPLIYQYYGRVPIKNQNVNFFQIGGVWTQSFPFYKVCKQWEEVLNEILLHKDVLF